MSDGFKARWFANKTPGCTVLFESFDFIRWLHAWAWFVSCEAECGLKLRDRSATSLPSAEDERHVFHARWARANLLRIAEEAKSVSFGEDLAKKGDEALSFLRGDGLDEAWAAHIGDCLKSYIHDALSAAARASQADGRVEGALASFVVEETGNIVRGLVREIVHDECGNRLRLYPRPEGSELTAVNE